MITIKTSFHYFYSIPQLYIYSTKQNHRFSVNINLLSNYTLLYPLELYSTSSLINSNDNDNRIQIIYYYGKDSYACNIM